ncbi:secondary thiamine-phosphate synthase enzyme YjbQ [Crocinitomix catalasitica]|uniref:secondary thiamine-phosphate synthase enzyme YjbQ n=1 Tax=Crocinitomix catalasitica TaxID=184607 RepID=UPI000A04081C|nr:secondary thiamine-phosphate synthase enzyme YjbQ [Crocinitomix catalasitica]
MIQKEIKLNSKPRGFHLVTNEIIEHVNPLPDIGILHLFIQHTSAGLCINENADPTVREDLNAWFDRNIKENEPYYQHNYEGPDDMPAHIKSILTGHSISIPIRNGALLLGTWQGIYLAEFRNISTKRKIIATIHQ